MPLEIRINTAEMAERLRQNMNQASNMVHSTIIGAANLAATTIVTRGRADIAAAGRFGSRWQDALQADVTEGKNATKITVSMEGGPPVSYWPVFEYGATISAKNPSGYMWLPFSTAQDAIGVWPRDYGLSGLFRIISMRGLPMLLDRETGEPQYFGKEEVHEPQKFHLRDIVKQVAKELRTFLKNV